MTQTAADPAAAAPDRTSRRKLGVEEEFHLVDTATRRLAPRAPELLDQLQDAWGATYVAEMQRCVVEMNSDVVDDLDGLRFELIRRRETLGQAASQLGLSTVAAGTVPLSLPGELDLTSAPRYRRMLADYQLLARDQLICGTQIHVDVADRDEAVAIGRRIAPHLPTLLALSASSPYSHDGRDTGYASSRTLVWQRWPTTGLATRAKTAADYDRLVNDLIATGVITDPGMIYFDIRPSHHVDTIELRICDSCPSVDTIVLIAGLFRALVDREAQHRLEGVPPLDFAASLGRAAIWRAARSGLEEDLVDVEGRTHRRAAEVVHALVESLRPQLDANGDWETVSTLTDSVLLAGSSASRQRRAHRRRGDLSDVVDLLIAETAARQTLTEATPRGMFAGYEPPVVAAGLPPRPHGLDEAIDSDGRARPTYTDLMATLERLGPSSLRHREARIEDLQRADGVTFKVTGQQGSRVLPLDLVPRIVEPADWEHIRAGAVQRSIALDAFLRDVYGDQQIVADGVVPAETLDRAPGFRSSGMIAGRGVRAHINGLDLVRDGNGRWCVIEDNLRIPSGIAYAIWNRSLIHRFLPEIATPANLLDVEVVPGLLHETLLAASPPRAADTPGIAVLTEGVDNSAYAEHRLLAERMGVALVTPEVLSVENAQLYVTTNRGRTPLHVLYARMDEDMLLSSTGADGQPLRAGVIEALHRGTLCIANAFGNGVADDKAVYAYVPAMIEYYLGEQPILANVPTFVCAEREQRDHVLAHLESLVTKPIDGYGGSGVLIGPDASDAQLAERREELEMHPEQFIAQEVVQLSTHPTFDGTSFRPHHIDLRTFVHLRSQGRGTQPEGVVMPAALTRVAAAGSKIVNSSAGGGCKDTWVLDAPAHASGSLDDQRGVEQHGVEQHGVEQHGVDA
ncbi:carboxylate-amine ligase [Kineosphaera limosa]|uniref:Putative glutamate--cysteine ligase 2 n=1 Tax=Kineosphaera limosa NBRC 100340 TaxID=1184609 RepID=K6WY44_9MICO|nr:carboxylate--amine ligase/circularly permuted type 2 ATP-grasp protein [Kineosphaera limosa]NYE00389.1 carboxylate-amine ligase [Kineosphaera limosa]GAB97027.1 putative carboxylate-amine ligase [Kineosphaera limosa NBRC 100340]